ncbi:MAG: aminoacyl-tRNA hydrolase [Alphaproteobacteria bacterium]|nr:MAG: aminoacyl-tRNA hydrolase [Alphaproteobacteria bacterium]
MLLLVGLGNPGSKYNDNRHNIGFMAVDGIVRRHNFSSPKPRFQGMVSEGRLGSEKILILKPQTFMNLSGQSVAEAARFYKIPPQDIFVFHDDLDIPAARIKFKTGGGHAGHNGLRNIDQHLGKEYHRIRMGIGHPGDKERVHGHVLGDFAKSDQAWLEPLLEAVAFAAPALNDRSGETAGARFLNEVGLRLKPNNK